MNIDIIILSNCKNADIHRMNTECLQSLFASEKDITFHAYLIESNKQALANGFTYNFSNLEVITPAEDFNYNRFMNIGIAHSKSDLIAFCNNDIVFETGWASAMLNIMAKRPDIGCLCPFDPHSQWQKTIQRNDNAYRTGYRIKYEFAGWCYLLRRSTMAAMGNFDEQFAFYFQDDDLCMTLKKHNLPNALVFDSIVYHLGHRTSGITEGFSYNERIDRDRVIYHKKWGSQRLIAWKNRLYRLVSALGLQALGKYIY